MADDLMDFSENRYVDEQDENCPPPGLMQSPVIVKSILKQSTKDNIIQLYTPEEKPVKGKFKVHFGSDSVLEIPTVKNTNLTNGCKLTSPIKEEQALKKADVHTAINEVEEKENWEERTSVLTKQDHQEYTQYARQFLNDIIDTIPIKDDINSSSSSADSGIEDNAMEVSEYEIKEKEPDPTPEESDTDKILRAAQELLRSLQQPDCTESESTEKIAEAVTHIDVNSDQDDTQKEDSPLELERLEESESHSKVKDTDLKHDQASVDNDSDEEYVDCEEAMEVDEDIPFVGQQMNKEVATEIPGGNIVEENKSSVDCETPKENNTNLMKGCKPELVTGTKVSTDAEQKLVEAVAATNEQHLTNTDVVSDSPEREPQKKSVDAKSEVDYDNLDPFKTKSQVLNTPDKIQNREIIDVNNLEMDPFISSKQVANTSDKPLVPQDIKATDKMEDSEKTSNDVVEINMQLPKVETEIVNEITETQEKQEEKMSTPRMEEPLPNQEQQSARSPELPLPKKGTYNLDDLDLDSMDPFKPKKQMINSPDVALGSNSADPFTSKKQLMNSPVTSKVATVMESAKDIVSSNTLGRSTTKPKEVNNEATEIKIEQSNKENGLQEVDVTGKPEPQKQLAQQKEKVEEHLEEQDPFKPKTQVVNSPPIKTSDYATIDFDKLDEIDPFKPKTQMQNSPANKKQDIGSVNFDNLNELDPFMPKTQMENSPVNKNEECANTPDLVDEIDPFKPKTQMQNSPANKKQDLDSINFDNLKELDPFMPKTQMENSPVNKNVKCSNTPDLVDEIDPFKPKTQMQNSPANKKQDLDSINFDNLEELDPFMPKSQMENSPVNKNVKCANTPDLVDEIDPFKPNSKVGNSVEDVIDPFSSKTQIPNSPPNKIPTDTDFNFDSLDEMDPFKPKSQVQNSPEKSKKIEKANIDFDRLDEIDPFQTNPKMQNSPVAKHPLESVHTTDPISLQDTDPFKPKVQMKNSPVKNTSNIEQIANKDAFSDLNPFGVNTKLANTPEKQNMPMDSFDDIDPFKPRTQMANSPSEVKGIDKLEQQSNMLPDVTSDVTDRSESGDLGDANIEVQGLTRRGEQPQGSKLGQFDGLEIDEAQFVPASEVFNDPGVWDMLEQFGSSATATSNGSGLSRMSLYTKFDPLVDEAPRLPRRSSIHPEQLEKLREYGLDETLLLLGTPPKKRRQSVMSQLKNMPQSGKNTPTGPALSTKKQETLQRGTVDFMLAFSPEDREQTGEAKTIRKPSQILSLMDDDAAEADLGIFQELKYTDADMKKLRTNLKLEMQGLLIAKDKEWSEVLEAENQKGEKLKMQLKREKENSANMAKACAMFEETINQLILKKDKEEKQTEEVRKERDQALQDIQSVENAFSDLHRRYEKFKNIFEGMKKNEEALKKCVSECQEQKKKMDKKFQSAEEKNAKSVAEIEKLRQQKQSEVRKSEAQLKLMQMKLEALEKTMQQKIEENKQLTDICDNLLAKVQ